jgi:hypothetical protein
MPTTKIMSLSEETFQILKLLRLLLWRPNRR